MYSKYRHELHHARKAWLGTLVHPRLLSEVTSDVQSTEYISLQEMKQGQRMCICHSAGPYTATLLVMVNVIKGGGCAPPPSPAQVNSTLMTECTPESRRYYSVYSVVLIH